MKLALFSDVHGRLRIVLHLMRCWQFAHQTELDGVLIAGDLGCFPDASKFDKATRRWIERDPEEAGFSKYFAHPTAEVQALLAEHPELGKHSAIRGPILFVPGNHEDYDFLHSISGNQKAPGAPNGTYPVDCYQVVHCILNGTIVKVRGRDGQDIRIAGLWGIENTAPDAPYRILPDAAGKLIQQGAGSFDLLLTHDVPCEAYPQGGSVLITKVIRACRPVFHLCGHAHPVRGQHELKLPDASTQTWLLENVSFGKDGYGTLAGCMAILNWSRTGGTVELVQDEWLRRMRMKNWQHVLPGILA